MAYQIQINDLQRLALLELLQTSPRAADLTSRDGPLEFWPAMLADLPRDEAESPGILHGFCL